MKKMFYFVAVIGIAVVVFNVMSRINDKRDLTIINDEKKVIHIEYTENGKTVSLSVQSDQETTGGKGFYRIHHPEKDGWYEVRYEYPVKRGKRTSVTLSEIMNATHEMHMTGHDYYTEQGKIDNINVLYEEFPPYAD